MILTTTPHVYIPKKGTSIHRKQELIYLKMPGKEKVLGHGAVRSPKPEQKLFSLTGSPETSGRERGNQDRSSHIRLKRESPERRAANKGSAGSQTAEEEGPERWGVLPYVPDCQQTKQEAANAHNRITGGGVGAEARLELTEGSADRK